MLRYPIYEFVGIQESLWAIERDASEMDARANKENWPPARRLIPDQTRDRVKAWLLLVGGPCGFARLDKALHRIELFEEALKYPMEWGDLYGQLKTLREATEGDLKESHFTFVPSDRAAMERGQEAAWASSLKKFPIKDDVGAALDCHCYRCETACVFHLMRVLEHGLRALAANVNLTFDLQNWQNIIEEIEAAIRVIANSLPKGAPKNDRLEFLSQAAREFFYFKEGWRNHVAHNRVTYDENQARSIMTHVRDFMNHLADGLP